MARRKISIEEAGYIYADCSFPNSIFLQSRGGPYISVSVRFLFASPNQSDYCAARPGLASNPSSEAVRGGLR